MPLPYTSAEQLIAIWKADPETDLLTLMTDGLAEAYHAGDRDGERRGTGTGYLGRLEPDDLRWRPEYVVEMRNRRGSMRVSPEEFAAMNDAE